MSTKDLAKKVFHVQDVRVVKRKILAGPMVESICFTAPSLLNRVMGLTQIIVKTTMWTSYLTAIVEDGVNRYVVTNDPL